MFKRIKRKGLRIFLNVAVYTLIGVVLSFSALSLFHTLYFRQIFIAGNSMSPTLRGGTEAGGADFGIIDAHSSKIAKIKRFKIVTVYFPFEDYEYENGEYYQTGDPLKENADYKGKRVIGLPGETIVIENNILYVTTTSGENLVYGTEESPFPFDRLLPNDISKRNSNITLKDNEYWVMGDNWSGSYDCSSVQQPIYKENIIGVLVAIEGYCTIKNNSCVNKHYKALKFY